MEQIVLHLESIAEMGKATKMQSSSNFQSIPFYRKCSYTEEGTLFIECSSTVKKGKKDKKLKKWNVTLSK